MSEKNRPKGDIVKYKGHELTVADERGAGLVEVREGVEKTIVPFGGKNYESGELEASVIEGNEEARQIRENDPRISQDLLGKLCTAAGELIKAWDPIIGGSLKAIGVLLPEAKSKAFERYSLELDKALEKEQAQKMMQAEFQRLAAEISEAELEEIDRKLEKQSEEQIESIRPLFAELQGELKKEYARMKELIKVACREAGRAKDATRAGNAQAKEMHEETMGKADEHQFENRVRFKGLQETVNDTNARIKSIEEGTERPKESYRPHFEGPGGSPKPVDYFTGREAELEEMRKLFQKDETEVICVVAHGTGGMGKTSLVQQFAYKEYQKVKEHDPEALFPDGIYWVSMDALSRDLNRLAHCLGWDPNKNPAAKSHIELVLQGKKALLVIDNAGKRNLDPAHKETDQHYADSLLKEMIPIPGGNCKTLLTTREENLLEQLAIQSIGKMIKIEKWSREESLKYMRDAYPSLADKPDKALEKLAEFVGHMPLGVKLISALLARKMKFREYNPMTLLDELAKEPLGALSALDRVAANNGERGIEKTFMVVWNSLSDNERLILTALTTCAKKTDIAIVAEVASIEIGNLCEPLGVLADLSLASCSEDARRPWETHDVIRLFVYYAANEGKRKELEQRHLTWCKTQLECDETYFKYRYELFNFCEEYHLTGKRLLLEGQHKVPDEYYTKLCNTLYDELDEKNLIEVAQEILPKCENDFERGFWLSKIGFNLLKPEEALKHYQKALEFFEAKYGEDSFETAHSHDNLGYTLRLLGEPAEALEHYQKALEIFKAEYGEGHIDTAASHDNLGYTLRLLGEPAEALKHYQKALEFFEAKYGEDSFETAHSHDNLGYTLRLLGEPAEALEHYQKALEICKAWFEEECPRIAFSHNNLGSTLQELGRPEEALEHYQKALEIFKAEYGEGHIDTAASHDNLGYTLRLLGEPAEALKHYQKALEICKAWFEEECPRIAFSHNNLGSTLQELGRPEEALEHYQKALEIFKAEYGEGHIDTAASHDNLGYTLQELGMSIEAEAHFQRAEEIRKKHSKKTLRASKS